MVNKKFGWIPTFVGMTRITSNKAYTLVEILLSAAIFGFALSVIMSGLVASIALNQASRNYTNAVQHAQLVMEEIRDTTFSGISTAITAGTWDLDASEITSRSLTPLNSETIAVTYTGTTTLDVTVTVNWNDLNTRARSLTLKTSICNI